MNRQGVLKALRIIAGFAVPTALYYVLRAFGVSIFMSLLASTAASALPGVVTLVRERRVSGISAYMTSMMLGSVVVSLVAGSPRFLLAREAVLTGVTGVWFITSVWWGRRPLAYMFSKPLLEGRMHWPGSWDTLWERSPRFRRMWRVVSVLYGIGTLGDAALRVVMAYSLPVDEVPALGTALYIATTAVLIIGTSIYYIACGVYNPYSAMYRTAESYPAESVLPGRI
jgi:intracellular septation protein A